MLLRQSYQKKFSTLGNVACRLCCYKEIRYHAHLLRLINYLQIETECFFITVTYCFFKCMALINCKLFGKFYVNV